MTSPTYFENQSPTPTEIDQLRRNRVTYLTLRGAAARGGSTGDLGWLESLPDLNRLYISGRFVRMPPMAVVRRLKELALQGEATPSLVMSDIGELDLLEIRRPSDVIGTLAQSRVRALRISGHDAENLEFIAGAESLREVHVWGRGQLLDGLWSAPPPRLEEFSIERADVRSFADLEGMASLASVSVYYPRSQRAGQVLDVGPLARCVRLRSLTIVAPYMVTGLSALADSASLEAVSFGRDVHWDADDALGVPIA